MPMPHLLDIQTARSRRCCQPDDVHGDRAGRRPRARLPGPVPDHGREREVLARVRGLRAGRAEVRGRGVHRARHDLRGAAQGDAAARHLRGGQRRRSGLKNTIEKEVYLGELPHHDAARHLRHQRRRARHGQPAPPLAGRGVRGGHPPQRAAAVLGADHPVPRLVGRVHRSTSTTSIYVHIDKKKKFPATALLRAFGYGNERGHPAALLRDEASSNITGKLRGPAGEARGDRRADRRGRRCRNPRGRAEAQPLGQRVRRRAHPGACSTR